jgi:very-long-chain (3R)-3-hydroxyacyl-CoA dehydratase
VLYPLGVASELAMAALALPTIRARRLLSVSLPNAANAAFDYYAVCLAVCASYAWGLPTLYGYMLRQRRRLLGGGGDGAKLKAV